MNNSHLELSLENELHDNPLNYVELAEISYHEEAVEIEEAIINTNLMQELSLLSNMDDEDEEDEEDEDEEDDDDD